jgi:hypothetical protein
MTRVTNAKNKRAPPSSSSWTRMFSACRLRTAFPFRIHWPNPTTLTSQPWAGKSSWIAACPLTCGFALLKVEGTIYKIESAAGN